MEKAVVTGALGFIGFHLCHRLLAEGIEVTAIDKLDDDGEKEEKLNVFGRNALFTWINGKLGDAEFDDAFNECDVCFHLCPVPPRDKHREESGCGLDEVFATADRPALSTDRDLPFLVVLSSTEVYGDQNGEIKKSSETLPVTSRGKRCLAAEAFFESLRLPLAILRVCEVYGPLRPAEGSRHQSITEESLEHYGNNIMYIDDVIETIYLSAQNHVPGIYNIVPNTL